MAMDAIGPHGLWSGYDRLPADEAIDLVRTAERLGYDVAWTQEGTGREPFALLGHLAARTDRIRLAVGIAQTTARDALAAHAAAATVHELSGGRMLMGLGVGHQEIEKVRGHRWLPPIEAMGAYLDAYRSAPYRGPLPHGEPPVVLAALRQRMQRLAAERTDGAFLYCVPLEAVSEARAHLDTVADGLGRPRPLLVVSLAVRLEADAGAAREAARRYLARYLSLPNYLANLHRLGFTDDELVVPGADRLVDALVAWGDESTLRRRLAAMRAAGADHVAMIPLNADGLLADRATVDRLAPPW
jgi:probable F420-dependent oxidoreductase